MTDRDAFERWYFTGTPTHARAMKADGSYKYMATAVAWSVWQAAAAAEREACAKACEEKHANGNWKYDTRNECASAIRARSKT